MIFKLKSYKADAEILGQIHEVEFTGDSLVIRGVDLSKTSRVLERLTNHEVIGCGIPGSAHARPKEKELTEPVPEKKYGNTVSVLLDPSKQEAEPAEPQQAENTIPKVEEKKAAPLPPPPPPLAVSSRNGGQVAKPQSTSEPPKSVTPVVPDGVPEIVVSATKLKEIVDYLQAQGHTTVAAILAEIERLKPHSPVLQRATDVEPRVKKMLSVPT